MENQRIPAPGMAQADLPPVIALAVGAAAVGAPEALALLLDVGGRNPAADVVIAVFLIAAVTSLVLGTMLLARYVRVAAAAGANQNHGARARLHHPGTVRFARVTLAVALAVAVFVAACLLAVPSGTKRARDLGGAATSCSE